MTTRRTKTSMESSKGSIMVSHTQVKGSTHLSSYLLSNESSLPNEATAMASAVPVAMPHRCLHSCAVPCPMQHAN
jgi:hypothetical protein